MTFASPMKFISKRGMILFQNMLEVLQSMSVVELLNEKQNNIQHNTILQTFHKWSDDRKIFIIEESNIVFQQHFPKFLALSFF